jgi:hypothetical protein
MEAGVRHDFPAIVAKPDVRRSSAASIDRADAMTASATSSASGGLPHS